MAATKKKMAAKWLAVLGAAAVVAVVAAVPVEVRLFLTELRGHCGCIRRWKGWGKATGWMRDDSLHLGLHFGGETD